MNDYYKTLGLNPSATQNEVKRAFRALTKRFHPDRNAHRTEWATRQMQRLIEAHRVLSNARLRERYDRQLRVYYGDARTRKTHYRYRRDETSLAAQAERILDNLLNGKAAEALASFERLSNVHNGFELRDHLELRDWVDAKFLIAEAYQRQRKFAEALDLYESLYHSEEARKRYTRFMQEVRDRILRICCRDLAPSLDPPAAVRVLMRALALDLTNAKRAFIHKKLAESHLACGDERTARRHLTIAFQLKPDLKGTTKICSRLRFDPAAVNEHG